MSAAIVRTCGGCGQKNRVPGGKLAAIGRCGACKADLPPASAPVAADEALFDAVVQGADVPVLVDFWAAWCGPCRSVAPAVEQVAKEHAGRAIVLKVDTDKHPRLAARFQVQGIPNFVVLKGGAKVSQQAGAASPAAMRRWLADAGA